MSVFVGGLPGPRAEEPSYFLATRLRYQRSKVSGVTMQAIPCKAERPKALARTASLRRCSLVRRKRFLAKIKGDLARFSFGTRRGTAW